MLITASILVLESKIVVVAVIVVVFISKVEVVVIVIVSWEEQRPSEKTGRGPQGRTSPKSVQTLTSEGEN